MRRRAELSAQHVDQARQVFGVARDAEDDEVGAHQKALYAMPAEEAPVDAALIAYEGRRGDGH